MTSHAPSYQVAEKIARREGISPTELSPPLSTVIDLEALDALVRPESASKSGHVKVEFTYENYVIRVRTDPEMSVSVQEVDASKDTSESPPQERAGFEE